MYLYIFDKQKKRLFCQVVYEIFKLCLSYADLIRLRTAVLNYLVYYINLLISVHKVNTEYSDSIVVPTIIF